MTSIPNTAPWRPADEIETNPIGLSTDAARAIVPELDRHLASLFVLFHQYQKHHWLVEGPQFRDLHLFLEEGYTEIHRQLDAVAERITALGGVPTASPAAQADLAYIEHEPEGVFRVADMLARDRAFEALIASNLRKTIRLTAANDDFGTETLLRGLLLKIEERAHHLDHYLGSDSLQRPAASTA
jgi:starvation-inducible DNA-binding protein